jgi:hypothetical protein
MKIYLAGGMTVINVKGRERELVRKFPVWHRLFSFFFLELIHKSEILDIVNENLSRNNRARK